MGRGWRGGKVIAEEDPRIESTESRFVDALDPPTKKEPRFFRRLVPGFWVKGLVLALLLVQNTTYTLLRRYSMANLAEKYDPQEVLLVGEVFKLVVSACATTVGGEAPGARLARLAARSGKMFGLAMIYGAMNVLSYVAIRRVDAAVFTVCAQLKILTTAAFSVGILRKRVSATKWRALVQLVLGCVLVTVPQMTASSAPVDHAAFFVGVVAVFVEVFLSGFASIYFEKVIKADEKLSVWDRNYQLALHSILLYLVYGYAERTYVGSAGRYEPFHDFSGVAWGLAFLGGGGGLLVAMTVKVADSVVKTLAVSVAIVTSTLASHFLLGGPLDLPMGVGAATVALSVLNYSFDASPVSA
ncbi:hypothetical protein CTAYLR_009699 [Chrysophaeum taylorii]|uniref:Uncharacterized protein n=1 Tax=Chrysophaeum taylorii TaxID=2483200 RepID=A0AAD7XKD8_9STRA|nr:hypothetical protein CTAYLR_009699 [Chrysophaeum taylorii]